MPESQQLSVEEIVRLLPRITAWRVDPESSVACPRCEGAGLTVVDRSARPHAEWYAVSCNACGLEETINIPLGSAVVGGLE